MAIISEKLANLMEYAGFTSRNYSHARTPCTYSAGDPLAYFVDESRRAAYNGPFDAAGLPLYVYKGTGIYLPVHICFWGLGHLEIYRQKGADENLENFSRATRWLAENQTDSGVWLTRTHKRKFGLMQPFPSAMAQGLAISCLCRFFKITGDREYLQRAVASLACFHVEVTDGGVTSYHGDLAFYEEYPHYPYHHVLNGFIYALWGLHDLARTGDTDAEKLYGRGLQTLIAWLPRFDIGYWSLYHISDGLNNPATVHYHRLHIDQLDVMHRLSGDERLAQYRDRWQGYAQGRFNAIRTLPAKLLWLAFYKPPLEHP